MPVQPQPYTTRIIKATGLIDESLLFLAALDPAEPPEASIRRIQADNLLGTTSRTRTTEIIRIFRRRFMVDPEVTQALSQLVRREAEREMIRPLLYLCAARADPLLADVVTEVLAPLYSAGRRHLDRADVAIPIERWVKAGRTTRSWSADTQSKVVQSVLTALRDFGLLAGTMRKEIVTPDLPLPSLALLARILAGTSHTGRRLVLAPEWRLYFLTPAAVERLLVAADQSGFLTYHAAGDIARIEFTGGTTLSEFTDVVLSRCASRRA